MPETLNRHKMLSAWDDSRQARYRAMHPDQATHFHFVLDASPSMIGQPASNLRQSFNLYLAWLKHHADPMSMAEIRCFSDYLDPSCLVPLGTLTPLTGQSYDPSNGNGTALYRAIGETCGGMEMPIQHVLVVFTDGQDNMSGTYTWTLARAHTSLTGHIGGNGLLAVFLGAMPAALEIGQMLGFAPGNCLLLTTDQIPEAFSKLTRATERYLAAGPQQRKLLAQAGVF